MLLFSSNDHIVSVLGQAKGYIVKYSPLPEGVPEGKAQHNCFRPPSLFLEGLLSTGPTRLVFTFWWRWGYHYIFSSIHVVRTRPGLYKTTPHKDLKRTKLCLGPIQTRLEAFWASWAKPK